MYSLLFVNKNLSLGFIKLLCTHDFSRVYFAAELSTTIFYNSVFVKYYDYIYILFVIIYIYLYIYIYIFFFKQSKFISQKNKLRLLRL